MAMKKHDDLGNVTFAYAWLIVAVIVGGLCALIGVAAGLSRLTEAWGWWAAPIDVLAFVTFMAAGIWAGEG